MKNENSDFGRNSDLSRATRQRLEALLGHFCSHTITTEQQMELESILLDHPAAQKFYHQYMLVHSELYWLHDSVKNPGTLFDAGVDSRDRRSRQRWLALAAALLILVGLGGLAVLNWQTPKLSTAELRMNRVATLTGTLNCRWGEKQNLGFGSDLYAGQQLELLEGVAEITFQSGTRVILQAPAKFDVSSYSASVLRSGRLTANCPPGSEGFRLHTNGLVLIDQGHEFGVSSDDDITEVHVFDGVVETHYPDASNGSLRKVEWRTNQTALFDVKSQQLKSIEKPGSTYVRNLTVGVGPMNGVLASEDFDYPLGPLEGQNGGFGWGGPWAILDVEEGNIHSSSVATGSFGDVRLSASGNHAEISGNFNRVRRELSTSFGGVFDSASFIESQDGVRLIGKEGNTLYIGFAQRVDQLDQVFYGFELNRGDGNKNRVLCIGHAAAKGWVDGTVRTPDKEAGVTGWAVTSEYNGNSGSLMDYGLIGRESLEAVYFVVKLTFGPDNEDKFELFVNPDSLLDENKCRPVLTGEGNFAFDRIALANFEGRKTFRVDHIRLGTSFPSVTRPIWTGQPVKSRLPSF